MDESNRKRKWGLSSPTTDCPYLDTIQRSLLDFDFEPSCSVSLESGPHVYGCLVCGKFFRGRGRHTPAYTHSVDEGHYVYVHLAKGSFHCLPDDYEIHDGSLSDISAALHPVFTSQEISKLDLNTGLARDLFGRRYLPGYVGLNNLRKTDCVNAIVQALVHVRPLRDFFLSRTHHDIMIQTKTNKPPHRMSHLAQCFGELVRKIWSDKRFKSHVDPHMLIQAISEASKKRFRVGLQAEAGEFLSWFLNMLHIGLGGTRKSRSSIIYRCFQGKVEMTTRQRKLKGEDLGKKDQESSDMDEGLGSIDELRSDAPEEVEIEEKTVESNFLQLTLDIPEKPLFRDDDGGLVIPQEPLVTVLKKFDGVSFSDALSKSGIAQRKRYILRELPPYLILHLSRFNANRYSREKNPTIVAFPVKNLDLGSYTFPTNGKDTPPTEEEVRKMDVRLTSNSKLRRVFILVTYSLLP
jgi:U4/U6.U5 tri-snRNP-associated protein 2